MNEKEITKLQIDRIYYKANKYKNSLFFGHKNEHDAYNRLIKLGGVYDKMMRELDSEAKYLQRLSTREVKNNSKPDITIYKHYGFTVILR